VPNPQRDRPGPRATAPSHHAVRRARPLAWLLLVTALAATGCASSKPSPFAPDPLDVTAAIAAPCSLLTPQRALRRHLQPPGSLVTGAEPGCRWNPTDPRDPSITANATNEGLAALHRGDFSYFQPIRIDLFPAVQTATGANAPHAGHCSVRVGVGDHARIDVTADYPAVTRDNHFSTDPCADATTLAAEIVNFLAAASP
jgi:hypothetical protein